MLVTLIFFELMFNLLISSNPSIKYSSIIMAVFFMALILSLYFLKQDKIQNKYLKQKINSYPLYAMTQIITVVCFNVATGILAGIFSGLFSSSPAANGAMILGLITTGILATAIVFSCRSMFTNHKYIATISLLVILLFSLADSNNEILSYFNWLLPPVANLVLTFQGKVDMVTLFPLIFRQFIYAIILFIISGFFNKKSYIK